MRHLSLFMLLAITTLALSGCSPNLRPFTQNMYNDYNWSADELKQIQFYLGEDVTLRRELTGGKSEITRGVVRVVDGRNVEEIVIRRNTPGVYMFSPKDNRLAVSFEDGGENRFLIFGANPRASDRYTLLGSDWNRNQGVVTYDGLKWSINGQDGFATLMVNLKRLEQTDRNSRVAAGRRVN